jgi:hypothetical protein
LFFFFVLFILLFFFFFFLCSFFLCSFTQSGDPRPNALKDNKEYVSRVEMKEEKVAYGEGAPDVSNYDAFLAQYTDMPLDGFLVRCVVVTL